MDESLRRPAPISARDVARILRRRAPIVLLTFLLVCAAVAVVTTRQHKVYEAQASILLDTPAAGNGISDEMSAFMGHNGTAPLDTEMAKIQSRAFLQRVIDDVGLGKMVPEDLKNRLQVSAGPGGQILLIDVRAGTAPLAQNVANTIVKDYIALAGEEFFAKSDTSRQRLIAARDKALREKIDAESKLQAFTSKAGLTAPTLYYNGQAHRTVDAAASLADMQKALPVQLDGLLKMQAMLKTLPPTVINGYSVDKFAVIDQYRNEISKLETQRNDLLFDYAPDNPDVQIIDTEILDRKKALAEAAQNPYAQGGKAVGRNPDYVSLQSRINDAELQINSLKKNIAATSKQLATLRAEQTQLAPEQVRYEALQRARDDANGAYEKARAGLIQIEISDITGSPYIHVLDAAPLPPNPISPRPILNGIMAVFLGLFLGVVAALVAEYMAGGFADEGLFDDLPLVGGVPLLGRLPSALPALASAPLEGDRSLPVPLGGANGPALPGSAFEDALREIGYGLMHREAKAPVPVVLLTSVRSDAATATLAAQLTATLIRDGLRVTLIDADRDHPRLNHFFGAPDAPGLTDVLANRSTLEQALHIGVNGNLRFLAAGSPGDRAPASEERLRQVFGQLAGNPKDDITDVIFVSGPTVWNARQIAPLEKAARGMVLLTFGESGSPDESVARVRRLLSNGYKPGIRGVIVEQAPATMALTTRAASVPPEASLEDEEMIP